MENDQRISCLRAAIAGALSLGKEATEGLGSDPSSLFHMVLKGLAGAMHDHAAAVLHLSDGEHIRSSKVLLRTLIESWIIASYVAADEKGQGEAPSVWGRLFPARRFSCWAPRIPGQRPDGSAAPGERSVSGGCRQQHPWTISALGLDSWRACLRSRKSSVGDPRRQAPRIVNQEVIPTAVGWAPNRPKAGPNNSPRQPSGHG